MIACDKGYYKRILKDVKILNMEMFGTFVEARENEPPEVAL